MKEYEYSLRLRPLWLAVGWSLIAATIWLSLAPSLQVVISFPFGDKLGHLTMYGVLMGWFGQLYQRPLMRLGYALSLVLMGVVLEFTQAMGGHRWFEVADMVANGLGVLIALLLLNRGADRLLYWWERRVMGLSTKRSESRESP